MKTSSAKAKGRRACAEVRDSLFAFADGSIPFEDIQVTSSGVTGEDLKLSRLAREKYPFTFEVKNQEKINIWSSIKQAESHAEYGLIPVLCFKRNNTDPYICMSLHDFLKYTKPCRSGTSQIG